MKLFIYFILSLSGIAAAENYPLEKLKLPSGFKIKLYAQVPGARSMALANDGTLFVGSGAFSNPYDRVYRIRDWDKDGKIANDEVEIFIDKLSDPNGVAVRGNSLYVAEETEILEFKNVLQKKRNEKMTRSQARVLQQKFPKQNGHSWKFIRFAPKPHDNILYVPVGAPCNICKIEDPYAAIHRLDVRGDKMETIARGVRNTVGFDFHPVTGNLWFTDNGRDLLGDDMPPDELNEVSEVPAHFGYPFCHGSGIVDPDIKFNEVIKNCGATKPPKLELGAHVASLGMRFYTENKFPKEYHNQIFVAEHGSWNRSRKTGYRVTNAFNENGKIIYRPFITGWLDQETQKSWGRPVDIQVMPDGSILISDDGMKETFNIGSIYQVTYEN